MDAGRFDAVVVGAGFAGLYALIRLRRLGFSARVVEAGAGVGGTWYWNRYPGARCDVESVQYSYQFDDELEQSWNWSERYATQPEILRYAEHVAARHDLKRDIDFDTRIKSAIWDEAAAQWTLTAENGRRYIGRFVVMATGCLSAPNTPKLPGLEKFAGRRFHTGHWPHEKVDFSGRRVAVIGTGSSAIQSIPLIAAEAKSLTVFQRTANYTIPAHNAPLDPAYVARVKSDYKTLRRRAKTMPSGIDFDFSPQPALEATPVERERAYRERWDRGGLIFMGAFGDLLLKKEANDTAADFVRARISEIVKDPALARTLQPTNVIGCKRLCVDTGYWDTFNKPHVKLVDLNARPLEGFDADAVRAGGERFEVDDLVLATGFDAMTGAMLRIDIRGKADAKLADKWAEGPRSYLGLAIAGFPNLFTVTGPGSPSVLTNMLPTIEQHVEWISDCIAHLRRRGLARIEADTGAEEAWVDHNRTVAGTTLRSTCSSWYVGANIAGKSRVFMPYIGGFPAYIQKCEDVVKAGYEGFALA
ncbi:MAG: NAD(P)/FAD-dependent oxidoreductase [Alphaproteobacteria bacterium]|nr:NAD(P)/FAD-dependent oxidoreductase [Alphaproteobacteria bacterium]